MRRTAVAALILTLLTACEHLLPSDPFSPLALHQEDGQVIVSLGCEWEGIRSVVIEHGVSIDDPPGSEGTVWRIEAADLDLGSPLRDFTVGVVPEGFVETHRYIGPWTGGFVSVDAVVGATAMGFGPEDGLDGWRFAPLLEDDPDGTWEQYQGFVTAAGDDLGGWTCEEASESPPTPQP